VTDSPDTQRNTAVRLQFGDAATNASSGISQYNSLPRNLFPPAVERQTWSEDQARINADRDSKRREKAAEVAAEKERTLLAKKEQTAKKAKERATQRAVSKALEADRKRIRVANKRAQDATWLADCNAQTKAEAKARLDASREEKTAEAKARQAEKQAAKVAGDLASKAAHSARLAATKAEKAAKLTSQAEKDRLRRVALEDLQAQMSAYGAGVQAEATAQAAAQAATQATAQAAAQATAQAAAQAQAAPVYTRAPGAAAKHMSYRRPYGANLDNVKPREMGCMDKQCPFCGALMWVEERVSSTSKTAPEFGMCCKRGKVELPLPKPPPPPLRELFLGVTPAAKSFRKNMRAYNNALASA
jgi:hypothetical protein